jgi:WD40 repeat protein
MWTAFAPDGRHLATAGGTGADTIHIWDLTTGRRTGLHHGAAPQVIWGATSGLCYSPDGRQLAVVSINGQVKILDPNTIPEARILSSNVGASIYQVAFSEDGERFLLSGDQRMLPQKDPGNGLTNQPVVSLWNASSGQELLILRGTRFPVGGAAFSPAPNSRRVASLPDSWVGQPNPGNEVTLWDYTTGKQIRSFQAPTKASNVIFSPDGRLLALGSKDSLEICDAETGKVVRRLSTPADSLSWSSDGRHLATADSAFNLDGIQVWNATEGTLWRHLAVPQATQNARSVGPSFGRLAFSPDGRLLAGASENNTQAPKPGGAVTVWDVETGQQVVTLRGHTNQVNGVAFSPDGRRLISGSSDGTVRVWELATGHTTLILRGHKDGVRCVAFSPDGRRIASSDGKETRIWDGSPMAIPPAEAALKQ